MKFYITTPIYYVNNIPHIGHAYTTIAADILARYHKDSFLLVGTDEHGAKIEQAAEQADKKPKEFCDEIVDSFKHAWKVLDISYDNFIRTTDKKHEKTVKKIVNRLYKQGHIYKGEYEGLYCVGCERYLSKTDLQDNKCPEHDKEPDLIREESYFFKLSQFQQQLTNLIENDEFKIEPVERKNEMLSFLKNQELRDVSISRKNVSWGIELPFDKDYTTYVWVDALINYLTGLGWKGDKLPESWPPQIQLMSKDILRVHATIWPALLLALNIPLPKKLFVHGYFLVNGQKMSKSLGNVIDPVQIANKYSSDILRYFLFREASFGRDGDFSEQRLIERYNSDLASGLGNLVSRVITVASKVKVTNKGKLEIIDEVWDNYHTSMKTLKFNQALNEVWKLISFCDKYVDRCRPWEEPEKKTKIISNLLYGLDQISRLIEPFMPDTSKRIFQQIKVKKVEPLFPKIS